MVLASSPANTPLESLAELADQVVEVAAPTMAAITPTQQQPPPVAVENPTSHQLNSS